MSSLYAVLNVDKSATSAEIRKAYRKQALLNHPDKNPGDEDAAQKRFLQVAEAYDVLGDEAKRQRYDQGGGSSGEIYQGFDWERASEMFNANFGESLMRQWQPGMQVSGTLVTGGKRVSITIHPDGTTEEKEFSASARASYRSTTTTMAGGGTMHTVQLQGSLGENLAALLVPDAIAEVPLLGRAATGLVAWLPTFFFGYFALRFLGLA